MDTGIDLYQFADSNLGEYRVRGREINARYCPFCNGKGAGNEYTFSINLDKRTYNCFRGSCNENGHYNQLRKHFGLSPVYEEEFIPLKQYVKPKLKLKEIQMDGINYLKSRGISEKTAKHFRATSSEDAIAFNYYRDDELVFVKYRKISEKKFYAEKDAEPILYNIDNCDYETPLVITEGEIDAMSVHEAGHHNVVSIPTGAGSANFIDSHWIFLNNFREIILFSDNDSSGMKLRREVSKRIENWKLFFVESELKDANEILVKKGKKELLREIKNPTSSLGDITLNMEKIPEFNLDEVPCFTTDLPLIDENMKGFRLGELTVVTGYSGGGKSTFVNQITISAINQGFKTFLYSGELKPDFVRYWLELSASCGNIGVSERGNSYLLSKYKSAVRKWFGENIHLYNNKHEHTKDAILAAMNYSRKRHGTKFFVIDNLMEIYLPYKDYYHAQTDLVEQFCRFAKDNDCHVLLVAHPHKTEGELKKKDISGSGNISNKADNILAVYRGNENGTRIVILKNRAIGKTDVSAEYHFDQELKRIHSRPMKLGWFDYMPTQQGFDYSE